MFNLAGLGGAFPVLVTHRPPMFFQVHWEADAKMGLAINEIYWGKCLDSVKGWEPRKGVSWNPSAALVPLKGVGYGQ